MVSNYSSDPNNISPVGNPATPGAGSGNIAPVSSSHSGSNGGGGSGQRRLAPGTVLSSARYQIEKLVASGGMGAVYRAIDTRFNRPCAVKEMLDEFHNEGEREQAVEWFSREAMLLLDLNHPCVPRVRDFFLEGGKHYLVMDFIEGRTLGEVLEKEGNVVGVGGTRGVPEARARSWAQQVCSVLSYLHRQSPPIIFRDLKPSNIMVTNRDEIKLIDFGIARAFHSQRQATIIMTLGYAPPEQLHGMPEPRSDLFALGATLHRVLTRHDASTNKPSLFSFPPMRSLRPDISPAFEQVLMRALAPNLEHRWANAADMERALINLPPITVVPPVGPIPGPGAQQQRPSAPQSPQTPSNSGLPGTSAPGLTPNKPMTSLAANTTGPAGPYITAALEHLAGGRIDAAYQSVMQANTIERENALVHRIFGQVFARRTPPQVDAAVRAYSHSLQLNPEDPETHKLMGDVWLFLRQQPQQGIPAYIQSLRLNAKDFEAHYRLGQCYEKTGQLEPALREYQEAGLHAPKQPPHPAIHYALGQLAMRMNRFAAAEQAFIQVLFINPGDHQTRFLLAQAYEKGNKLEDAWREINYVIGYLGSNPAVPQLYEHLRTRLRR